MFTLSNILWISYPSQFKRFPLSLLMWGWRILIWWSFFELIYYLTLPKIKSFTDHLNICEKGYKVWFCQDEVLNHKIRVFRLPNTWSTSLIVHAALTEREEHATSRSDVVLEYISSDNTVWLNYPCWRNVDFYS